MATAHKIKNVSDRVKRAQDLLLYQFKDKQNINAFVDAVVTELQELEDVITGLQDARTLKGSYGVFLDEIGRELKLSRGNYADDDYKTALKIEMAKKTSSATAEDILFLVELLTGDPDAMLINNYPYLLELTGYLYCLADDLSGLEALADLFPVNSRVRLIQQYGKSFKFGTTGRGFGSGSTLNNLVYYRDGISEGRGFVTSESAIMPPTLSSAPFNIVNPFITGGNVQGDVLIVTAGEWAGTAPIVLTYQWLRDGVDIVGETGLSYMLDATDLGTVISCSEIATNSEGVTTLNTNSVVVSEDVPVVPEIVAGLGIGRTYKTTTWDNTGAVTSTASITFNNNGSVDRVANVVSASQWLTTVLPAAGNDYWLSYEVVSGNPFTNLNPNALHDVSSSITFEISITRDFADLEFGEYTFFIRSKADSSISSSNTVVIGAEIVDTFN